MLRWFHALLPKEERFFELFARHSRTVVAGAEALRNMLEGGESISLHCQEIMAREHEADNIAREVLLAVRRTFITPFDRGDIIDLISSMDDSIDQMQKTAKVIALFDVRAFDASMREIAEAIVQSARLVDEAVPLLSSIAGHAGRLGTLTEEITRIEEKADELHDRGLKQLYESHGSSDPMAFVIGSEIYDHLEKVVDRFDDVSNKIYGIVIEHI
jgi:predicted phosphate transport protein (TIGR00153 family)